jgi:hypothetical protein
LEHERGLGRPQLQVIKFENPYKGAVPIFLAGGVKKGYQRPLAPNA